MLKAFDILRVDLSTGSITRTACPEDPFQRFIGGKGLAGHFLHPHLHRDWEDPLLPLIFMAGPLTGTLSPSSGRISVMSRSPLTGAICDCSVGGSLGWELRKAGLGGMIITGRAPRPSGIEISDRTVTVTDASGSEGEGTDSLGNLLADRGAVVSIGPAAWNGVRFASIMVDGAYTAGRGGLGLVMASRNLGHITVRGTGRVPVEDPDGLRTASEDIRRLVAATPALMGEHGLRNCGTAACYDLMSWNRMMPTANFTRTFFPEAAAMNSHAFADRWNPHRTGCRGCHLLCKRVGEDGVHLPEFETMSHFSALLSNADLDAVRDANTICNRMGMDTISAGATLACFSEATGEKLAPCRITGLLMDMALGRGEGIPLGKGSLAYAKGIGRPELSMSVKGMELPAYDPRGAMGMALGYAVSTRGGCHLRAYPISHEILRKPVSTDRFSFEGKARIVKISEDVNAVVDSLTACKFFFFGASLEEYSAVYNAVTGAGSSAQDLQQIGERIYFRERMMNASLGFASSDDDLPPRFFTEAGSHGAGIEVGPVDREAFLQSRERYYRVRGLDDDGIPLPGKIRELGLEEEL